MLVTLFAPRTPFSNWAIYVVGQIMDVTYGDHYHIAAYNIEQLREAWKARNGRAVMVTTDWPDIELAGFLISSGFPCLAIRDDPTTTFIASAAHYEPDEGLRVTASVLSALSTSLLHRRVEKLDDQLQSGSHHAFVEAVMGAIFGDYDQQAAKAICERIAGTELDRPVAELVETFSGTDMMPAAMWMARDERDRIVASAMAECYGAILRCESLSHAEWPLEMFFESTPDSSLVGNARCIVWGPYLCLPAGNWRAAVHIEIADNHSGNEIEADVCMELKVAARGRVMLPPKGFFSFSLDFEVTDPRQRIELRIHMLKGAIEGKLKLRRAVVDRIEPDAREISREDTILVQDRRTS